MSLISGLISAKATLSGAVIARAGCSQVKNGETNPGRYFSSCSALRKSRGKPQNREPGPRARHGEIGSFKFFGSLVSEPRLGAFHYDDGASVVSGSEECRG